MKIFSNWFQQAPPQPDPPSRTTRKTVIYDCETYRCIPIGNRSPDLEYCQGWNDFKGMGISVIGAYSSWDDRYHVYLQDNFLDFQALINQAEEVVGFNSLSFDDQLCAANGLEVKTTYDILYEVRVALGMPPQYVKGVTRGGYLLEELAKTNLGYGKCGTGAIAPELWQRGQRGRVINYCLGDVDITRKLYEQRLQLIDPTNGKIKFVPYHLWKRWRESHNPSKSLVQDLRNWHSDRTH